MGNKADQYRCSSCHKPLPIDHSKIKVGDKVDFSYQVTKITKNGASIKISSRTGKVVSVTSTHAEVTYRGVNHLMELTDITPYDAPNALTIAMQGLCECKGDNHE
ncbi:hypothetical protein FHU10_1223 [Serratia fonticola]|uniref:Uncharacterized protein n=1 Tax=Serratia fonticola TaxID=47917 RepID=A0A559T2D7_SERFO|nr:hypothetical protein [Serratia fonticola]TQI78736.1 hypothetical protein FHU09_1228 [Serratia fonticola]TQI99242.1 hypothetical protein FHU11_4824 [Serratia fonticola]TVZ68767.1 hypothetical protein FHU10_1223 [Serratia fonticola]